jgi:hypothetical protein
VCAANHPASSLGPAKFKAAAPQASLPHSKGRGPLFSVTFPVRSFKSTYLPIQQRLARTSVFEVRGSYPANRAAAFRTCAVPTKSPRACEVEGGSSAGSAAALQGSWSFVFSNIPGSFVQINVFVD